MKSIKNILMKMGLFNAVGTTYNIVKQPSLFVHDIAYRMKGAPDGYPLPSPMLIYLATGHVIASSYYEGGNNFILKLISYLKNSSIDINNFKSILDFGCGSGRLMRHLTFLKEAELFGSDYNENLIKWCQKNLKFAKFQANNLTPPLNYNSDTFDFIYLFSVFTHLDKKLQKEWIVELRRVLKPNGIIFFSTHGIQYIDKLSRKQKMQYEAGHLATQHMEFQGKNHAASFQSRKFVEDNLLEGFELLSYIPGDKVFKQDAYIIRKSLNSTKFAPL